MKQFLFFLSTFFAINIFAQTIPLIEWQKCIGGTSEDYLYKTSPTSDGGSITVGWGGSADGDAAGHHGGYDFLAAKLDASGNKIWSRCYGGNNGDIGNGIQQTADGGYIMCGSTNSKNNGDVIGLHGDGFWADGWLVKLDAAGNITWQKCLGGTNGETLIVVQQTPDGGYIAAGSSSSTDGDASTNYGSADAWIVKLTASGTILWQRSYGGSKEDLVTNILQLADGNYIFSARSKSGDYNLPGNYGKNDVWFGKLDGTDGALLWSYNYGGSGEDNTWGLEQANDGSNTFIAVGYTDSPNDYNVSGNHGLMDVWVLRVDIYSGILMQANCYGGSNYDYAIDADITFDGGFIFNGETLSTDGDVAYNADPTNGQVWVVKFNKQQMIDWQTTIGGPGYDEGYRCFAGSDGSYTLGCTTTENGGDVSGYHGGYGRDYWMVKLGKCFVPPASTAIISANGPACGGNVTLTVPGGIGYTYQWKRNGSNVTNLFFNTYFATTPGTYTCTVTNGACGSTNSPNSIVSQKQSATVSPAGTVNKCAADPVTLTANTGASLTYQWYRGVNAITGATNSSFTTKKAGKYRVIVYNSNSGCSGTSKPTSINNTCKETILAAGTNDEDGITSLSAALEQNIPNPVKGQAIIRYRLPDKFADASITVTDITGRIVKQFMLSTAGSGAVVINKGMLAQGTYVYALYVEGKFITSRRMMVIQ